MERRLVRYTTVFTCIFSVFVCVAVWFLPVLEHRVEDFAAGIIREQREREERYALLEKMTGLEIMEYNTQQAQEQARREQEQALREQEQANREQEENAQAEEGSAVDAEEIPQVEVNVITHQMQLELPKGTNGSEVEIIQDYIHKQIRIGIPHADENYLYDYQMIGESDKISRLDYTSSDGSGTILLTMKNVMEAESSSDEDYLYLDFTSPQELYERIIVVDAGHGGTAPGAVSGEYYEKNITLAVVQQIKKLFEEAADPKIGVYYTRLDDTDQSLSDRVGLANNLNADLFVSVHINSLTGDASVEGVEVMYDELAEDTAFDTQDFAQICLDETVKAMGAKKRHLIDGHKIHIIRNSNAPAALIELGFINNPMELAKLTDPAYQRSAAQGIYNALLKSLKRIENIEGNQK